MGWPLANIGSNCLPVETWNPAKDGAETTFHYIDIGSVDQALKRVTSTTVVTGATAPSRARQLIRDQDVLVSTVRPNLNSVAKLTGVAPGTTASTGFCVLRSDPETLDSNYLFAWVRTSMFVNSLMKKIAGANYPAVSQSDVRSEEIPLPPLDDQKRIAHLLGKVEGLIAQRKQHLQQLDTLLKSVFLEMFGIDQIAENEWPKVALGSKTQIVSGVTKGKRYADQAIHEVPYMRVANVQDGHLNLSEIKTIEVSEDEIERYQLRRGDLLLTEGGDPDKLGRGALWSDEIPGCIHQNHIFRVRTIDDSINPKFLSALIGSKYGKSYFLKAAKQTTGIASINSTQLKSFPLIIPPIDLQNKFAAIVERVEGIKTRCQKSLADLEALYGTLSQKAFTGDLDLSRVRLQGAEA